MLFAAALMLLLTLAASAAAQATAAADEPRLPHTIPTRFYREHQNPPYTYPSSMAGRDAYLEAGLMPRPSHQTLPQTGGSTLHARVAQRQRATMAQALQVLPAEQDPCVCIPERCGAGRYFDQGSPHEVCSGCWCQECWKGSFKPGNVSWGEAYQFNPKGLWGYHFGYYQCSPCCTCNPDGYTTASGPDGDPFHDYVMYSNDTGAASRDECNVCLPGYGRHEQLGGVPSCVCLPCPSGTYSGKLVSGNSP